jgi:hypothetical protein
MRRLTTLLSFVLACASSVIVARAQSSAALPKPGPEVKKLAVMVGRFTNEGEVKAGAMGPNSPLTPRRAPGTRFPLCVLLRHRFGLLQRELCGL